MGRILRVFFRGQNLKPGIKTQIETTVKEANFEVVFHRRVTHWQDVMSILDKQSEPAAVLINADSLSPADFEILHDRLGSKYPNLRILGFTQTEERAFQVDSCCDYLFVEEGVPNFLLIGLGCALAEIKRNHR